MEENGVDKDALIHQLVRALQMEYDGYQIVAFDPEERVYACPHCGARTKPDDAETILAHPPDCPNRYVDEALTRGERYLMGVTG